MRHCCVCAGTCSHIGPIQLCAMHERIAGGRRLGRAALVALAFASSACGPALAQVQLGRVSPPPDQEVVEGLVCRGDLAAADRYLEDRGATRAERTERVERARKAVAGKPGCECAAASCRAEGGR